MWSSAKSATIHPHVVIYPERAIGDRLLAHAHAIVREHCVLGDDVILQNGAVIGCDGFGFAPDGEGGGGWKKITQSGPAVLEDAVEVQANSCIDRASIGETRVGRGSQNRQPGAGGARLLASAKNAYCARRWGSRALHG